MYYNNIGIVYSYTQNQVCMSAAGLEAGNGTK